MSNIINKIRLSGTDYTLSATSSGGASAVEVTQAEYDALVSGGTVDPTVFYIITDAQPADMSQYWTSAQTNSAITEATSGKADTSAVTESINAATSGKVDTSTFNTYSGNVETALSGKQDTLSAGTGIDITDNVISATGGGGGGKAIEAGRGISITTGETADTVSFNLPIYSGTGVYAIQEGYSTSAMSYCDHAEGYNTKAKGSGYAAHAEGYDTIASGYSSHAEGRSTIAGGSRSHAEGGTTKATGDFSHSEGNNTKANGDYSHTEGYSTTASSVSNVSGIVTYFGHQARHAEGCNTLANNSSTHTEGYYTIANNFGEHASGVYNNSTSATTAWGNSGNTLFSVGNGTADNARHNAFEIRQNGDMYLNNGTSDIKLQDYLQIKVVKLTQSAYDALSPNYDSNTLYIIKD